MPARSADPPVRYGLIGHPLGFSLSSAIHAAAFADHGLRAEYRLLPTGPGELAGRMDSLRDGELQGANVTIPHKAAAAALVDDLSDVADELGAVNTLVRMPDGWLRGENTDVAGLRAQLTAMGLDHGHRREALVLGAGGAARAAARALVEARWHVRVLARRSAQSGLLAAALYRARAGALLSTGPWSDAADLLHAASQATLLVNATPLGSNGSQGPWPDGMTFPASLEAVIDLVAWPLETALVARAREAGLVAEGGLTMLVAQAGEAFRLWTGLEPPIGAMREAALAEASRRQAAVAVAG